MIGPGSVPAPMWLNAVVRRHRDADTFYCDVTMGKARRIEADQSVRLLGCNARELSMPGGQEAAAALADRPGLTVGSPVALWAVDDDKFAPRWDCSVAYLGADGKVHDLVTDLVAENWVAPWNGRGTAPLPPWPRRPSMLTAGEAAQLRQTALDKAVSIWRRDCTR